MEQERKISKDITREPFWSLSPEETLSALRTSDQGLTEVQAKERQAIFGPNVIAEKEHLTWITIALRQFQNPLTNILLIACVITLILRDWIDAGAIFAAALVNILFGFWQEFKAEKSLESLKTYIQTRARVIRDGIDREIDAADLVPGDIISVSQGNRVPADARLIYVNNFEVDESALTGESLPVTKNTATLPAGTILSERKSMLFSGTLVFQGIADAVVTSTGANTEFGKIASLVAKHWHEQTPLQRAIGRFTLFAGLVLGALTAVLFVAGLIVGYRLYEMFIIAVAVAVAAVPAALPVALTVALAIGVVRLAEKKGVVRKLLAAETLGSTTLILTDKTGTLTQAKMRLEDVYTFKPGSAKAENELLHEALYNTDVIIENPNDPQENWKMSGRAIEIAIVRAAAERGILYPYVKREHKIIDHLPFSSEHKLSASLYSSGPAHRLSLLGAPEAVLRHVNLPEAERALIEEEVQERASSGERVLGVAAGIVEGGKIAWQKFLSEPHHKLSFLGLLSLSDPLRPEAKGAVKQILDAGVRTVIVTGDHKGTAESIAKELSLIGRKEAVEAMPHYPQRGITLTGADLKLLSQEELAARAKDVSVFARVDPQQKLQLVNLYKSQGEIVAVTGDGINDAPALHAANIGVAVGSGTEVAKNAADLVLLDDNFQTLVTAIKEGRKIIDNIRRVIVYLLSNVLDSLFLIGGALLTGLPLPLNSIQILFVNFVTGSFPVMALAFEEGIDDPGKKPRKIARRLIDREMGFMIIGVGLVTSILLFMLYYILAKSGAYPMDLVRTFIFATYATYVLFLPFAMRSFRKSVVSYNPFSNRHLVGAALIGIIMTVAAIYLPAAQAVLQTVSLPAEWLAAVVGFGMLCVVLVEMVKTVLRKLQ
jgi:Ca2+-transporting ATPase